MFDCLSSVLTHRTNSVSLLLDRLSSVYYRFLNILFLKADERSKKKFESKPFKEEEKVIKVKQKELQSDWRHRLDARWADEGNS